MIGDIEKRIAERAERWMREDRVIRIARPSTKRSFTDLRPMTFADFVGQKRHVRRLKRAIAAARAANAPLEHCAFIGPAGTGKTSLAACCANELGRTAIQTVGSAIKAMDDISLMIDHIAGGIIFCDEAHEIATAEGAIMSGMLPLLEDWTVHDNAGARTVTPFTFIVASTSYGMLDSALRSRLGIPYQLDAYSPTDMALIAERHATKQSISIDRAAAAEIGKRARGNPRYCGKLVKESWNVALAAGLDAVTVDATVEAFSDLGIDERGLTHNDRRLLDLLANGRCSLSRCASYLGLDTRTYQEDVESFLFQSGYITVSSVGRTLTEKGERLRGL